jgi:hypothetical protein
MKKYFKEGKLKNFAKILKEHVEETRNMPVTIDPNRIIVRNTRAAYPMSKGLLSRMNKNKNTPNNTDTDKLPDKPRFKK